MSIGLSVRIVNREHVIEVLKGLRKLRLELEETR
jgi:hypothetical protein